MTLDNAVWLLTGLAAVVVLLTRMRLSNEAQQSGHALVPRAVVNAHTLVGVVALGVWVYYLTSPDDVVGIVTLAVWWIEVLIGLLILGRWMSRPSKHAADATGDTWAQGPALSILGHVGMLLGISFFTWIVLADKISA
ncbi:hypothetical protein [Nocardioides bizhenqiangii]|uniref:Integral membrane protein n=1 Tax=Nocardioides bizhenqiangii TaxID=3095076 RepID=A0ABZ0ZRB0_9ACTN|nr:MULTISPECIES: hypothetical protein [unclassified Nocardioides]MDZ5622609.1 hypothetical protein [Nocardioides sp. HM23]WQQ26878.1 hypothetical protein SHK19_01290 [Nocardioides sp. HM61]